MEMESVEEAVVAEEEDSEEEERAWALLHKLRLLIVLHLAIMYIAYLVLTPVHQLVCAQTLTLCLVV